MKKGRERRFYLMIRLFIIIIYLFVSISVDSFHNHPNDIIGTFHEDCPACLWNDQNNNIDNKGLQNTIIQIICNSIVVKFRLIFEDRIIHNQIVLKSIWGRGPPPVFGGFRN